MRACSDLGKLHAAVLTRINRLRSKYDVSKGATDNRSLLLAGCVIELDNLVLGGLRQFTVSSLKGTRTVRHHWVTSTPIISQETEAGAYILSVLNSVRFARLNNPTAVTRKEEPTVRDPKDTEKVLQAASASNIPSLQTALSLNSPLFRDLGIVRNFYAHRNADTWRKARNVALAMNISVRHADEIVTAPSHNAPATIFDDWLFDAELFFDELMQ